MRDAFGLDWGFAQAIARGLLRAPRVLFTGSCLTQTGGHGDWREPHEEHPPIEGISGLIATPRRCDSPDEMRRAAREMLRTGAHAIKIMAGGGCISPTDELEHTQFTVEEMAAACYEARTVEKIAMAHVYTPQGILNAVRAGVGSIEHGNFLDEESAAAMRAAGVHFVPTLTTYELISAFGESQGIPRHMLEKINKARAGGRRSLEVARAAGLKICSGSDVLASMQPAKAMELSLKAAVLGAHAAILSATRTNAASFGMEGIPRISRAQKMDALSSQANIAGYKAVLIAAESLPKFFPMLMTAAGTVFAARALVIGAGVAGLQAIATARRLGAQVWGYDVRPIVKEQVESLGAKFLEFDLGVADAEDKGGYAKAL
ncbi:MAG: hypothetical protein E6J77_17910, partial [Deltaproteobacteria bacterium]